MSTYPDHIYDPARRQIATELMQHELRKLLPSLPYDLWPQVDNDIANWYDGKASELAEVHDFWNAFDGIMRGFKLKGMLSYVTAANIDWHKDEVNISDIEITWRLPILAQLGEPPYRTQEVKDALLHDANFRELVTKDSDNHAMSSAPRDQYPVILLPKGDAYAIADGNRRVLRALVQDRSTIEAWIAEGDMSQLREYWVTSGSMRNMIEIADQAKTVGNQETVDAIGVVLKTLFSVSTVARINYLARVKDRSALAASYADRYIPD